MKWWFRLIVVSVPLLTVLSFVAWNERSPLFGYTASSATIMLIASVLLVDELRREEDWESYAQATDVDDQWEGPRPGKDDET